MSWRGGVALTCSASWTVCGRAPAYRVTYVRAGNRETLVCARHVQGSRRAAKLNILRIEPLEAGRGGRRTTDFHALCARCMFPLVFDPETSAFLPCSCVYDPVTRRWSDQGGDDAGSL